MDIRTVTVVGANGTMGCNISGIFASFGNAKVYMISRSIEKSEKAAVKAAKSVKADSIVKNLIPADYSMLESCIRKSDLVFESCAENYEVKKEITKQIAMYADENTICCSGTSGLSITALSECFPEHLRKNPVGASGTRMFLDLYKQIVGKAGGYQLNRAKNGMMLNIGGSATTNYAFIVGEDNI